MFGLKAKRQAKQSARERREQIAVEKQALIETLRDDSIAVLKNAGLTYEQAHERGGPTSSTIGKWVRRETRTPQLATIVSLLRACDHDLYIAPKGEIERRSHGQA